MAWVENQPVVETAVEKGRKVCVGPWGLEDTLVAWFRQERPPRGGHQLYVRLSAHRVAGEQFVEDAGSKRVFIF